MENKFYSMWVSSIMSIKIDYSDYPKRLISRIIEVYVFFKRI